MSNSKSYLHSKNCKHASMQLSVTVWVGGRCQCLGGGEVGSYFCTTFSASFFFLVHIQKFRDENSGKSILFYIKVFYISFLSFLM